MFIMPRLVNQYLILPWFIGEVLCVLQNELAPMFETKLYPIRKIRTATTVAGEVLTIWAMLIGSLQWELPPPRKALLRIYVLWTMMRSMNLTKSVEGNILLVRIKCVLLAFMWGASIPWLA